MVALETKPEGLAMDLEMKRTVHFAPEVETRRVRVLSRHDLSVEEKADYWLSEQEFQLRQTKTKLVVVALMEFDINHANLVSESYEAAQYLAEYLEENDEIDRFFENPTQHTKALEKWTSIQKTHRGLENLLTTTQKSGRSKDNRETRLMVIVAVRLGLSKDDVADLYAALSWMPCLFSRMMGHADYTATYNEDNPLSQLLCTVPENTTAMVANPPKQEPQDLQALLESIKLQSPLPKQDLTPYEVKMNPNPTQRMKVSRAA